MNSVQKWIQWDSARRPGKTHNRQDRAQHRESILEARMQRMLDKIRSVDRRVFIEEDMPNA